MKMLDENKPRLFLENINKGKKQLSNVDRKK